VLQTGSTPTTAVTIDTAQNMGVGTTPTANYRVDAYQVSNDTYMRARTGGSTAGFISENATHKYFAGVYYSVADAWQVHDITNGATRLTIDASGNLGLGVTPSAWASGEKAIDAGIYTGLADNSGGGGGYALFGNAYEYATGSYKYKQNYYATLYRTYAGQHQWFTAASGTAGNAITFAQAMTLDTNGTLTTACTSSNALNIVSSNAFGGGNANFVTMYLSGMTAGTAGLALGKSGSTYNTSKIVFGYASSGSSSNYLGLGFWDADSRMTIYPTGAASLTGALTQNTSDDRLKTDFQVIKDALAKVRSLSGFTHAWNELAVKLNSADPTIREAGVSAQKVKQVLPEAVCIAPFDQVKGNRFESESGEDYLTVMYEKLVPLLIEAVKELEDKVITLEAKVGA
jgi:hypothetical protein